MPFVRERSFCALHALIRKWKPVPERLTILTDMVNADIAGLIESLNHLWRFREMAAGCINQSNLIFPDLESNWERDFSAVLEDLGKHCKEIGLDTTKNAALWARFKIESDGLSYVTMFHHAEAVYSALVIEATDRAFFSIKPDKAKYYSRLDDSKRKPLWGEKVETSFPSAAAEIVGASNCFALEEWTACVFHCMRILEASLVALAKKFSVPYNRAEWNTIIEGIEKAVRAIDPAFGSDWKDQQKFYGEAARHLMFIKNSWRNHVMHVRDEYDEGKALSILQHTRELTTHLSEKLSEKP
jgi:hypothetical protein